MVLNLILDVNWLAIIVSVIISVVLGFLWYGPLFGKPWMKLMNINPKDVDKKKKRMGKTYFVMIISTLISVYILSLLIINLGATTIMEGAMIGFLVWIGFIATITLSSVLWEGKSIKLYMLNNSYNLIVNLIAGALLAVWR